MSLQDDISLLRNVQMFVDFDDEHLRLISFGSQKMHLKKGHELYRDRQRSDAGYVVFSGSVDLFSFVDGEEKLLGNFKTGSLMGEISLISPNQRSGTAIVKEDCELMKISRIVMHRVLNEYPELAAALQRRISASVLKFTKDLDKVRL